MMPGPKSSAGETYERLRLKAQRPRPKEQKQKELRHQVQKALTDVGAKICEESKQRHKRQQELNDLRELVFALTNDCLRFRWGRGTTSSPIPATTST